MKKKTREDLEKMIEPCPERARSFDLGKRKITLFFKYSHTIDDLNACYIGISVWNPDNDENEYNTHKGMMIAKSRAEWAAGASRKLSVYHSKLLPVTEQLMDFLDSLQPGCRLKVPHYQKLVDKVSHLEKRLKNQALCYHYVSSEINKDVVREVLKIIEAKIRLNPNDFIPSIKVKVTEAGC